MITLKKWHHLRYSIYSPLYDMIGLMFMSQRKRSVELSNTQSGDKILLLGAGTGLDLEYLHHHKNIIAIDISPLMLGKLRKRAARLDTNIQAKVMDGENLQFPDESFDVVFLHMIIAVIKDPVKCIREAERVVRTGGIVMMFDIFLPDDEGINLFRRIINPLADFIASDLNRKVKDIIRETSLIKVMDEDGGFGGLFKIVKLKK